MGGDDSQKLLPWRGLHSSPGRKPPAYLQNNTLAQRHLISAVGCVTPLPGVGRCQLSSRAVRVQILSAFHAAISFQCSSSSVRAV